MIGEEFGSALWRKGEGGDPSLWFCKYREQFYSGGFDNTEKDSSLVACNYREQLQCVSFCKYREQLLCLWFARAESHLPKFTRSNLLNWKSSVAPVQPGQGQVQPVKHRVQPVKPQVQPVQRQVQNQKLNRYSKHRWYNTK